MDQWFTTRIDRTWSVLDLKIWLLSKALPTPELPLPASFRPSSPVTFAAAPPPTSRPPNAASYQASSSLASSSSATLAAPQTSAWPVSPITFADAPIVPARPSEPIQHHPPQSPVQHLFYPPLSPAPDTPTRPVSPGPSVPSPASARISFDQDEEDLPLYANSYGAALDQQLHDEDSDVDLDEGASIVPRSIPYSFNTGAPAISGLTALKSTLNKNVSGRGYSGSLSNVDVELARKATSLAKRWLVYSFSTGMLLSDDRPLTDYSIRAYELLELHRAGAYTARAYPSDTARRSSQHRTQTDTREPPSSESSDDEYDHMTAGSPYVQPYFDGWVRVLREGASRPHGTTEPRTDVGDADGQGRKMRRRGRAKSEAAKSGRGKDRTRLEREWNDLKHPLRKEGDTGMDLEERSDRWRKRWLIIREGFLTVWKERRDDFPEERYNIASCAGLYGADRLASVMTATSDSVAPSAKPHLPGATASHGSSSTSRMASASPPVLDHVICARFRQRSSDIGMRQAGSMDGKSSRKYNERHGTWLVLKLDDATTHEHLLRIFHRLSYSSPVSSSSRPSTSASTVAQSHTLPTRTLRTDFVPNPIPHPLALSFSSPSPPVSPMDELTPSGSNDEEWVDAGSSWGRPRRKTPGKAVPKYFGLGRGVVGVRYPEWREDVIQKAIHASRGLPLPESWGRSDLSPDAETPRKDQLDMYGFVREDLDNYAAGLVREDYGSDDSDSDAFSEAEWEGWAYDLDRPKFVDEIGAIRKPVRDGLTTPQGSPVSDPEPATVRDQYSPPLLSPTSSTPTTPSARLRASTISSHTSHSTITNSVAAPRSALSPSNHTDRGLRPDAPTAVRAGEPHTAGGVRGLMRGLSMRVGKESFMRGLENALDFVEGK
ncbi:hypothetical protein JB92DRAFT_2863134 [Gautieria morchelliformis]|nr:hypothetical protein JB92DRAFT_2863134 [Gautieria morchelliformis]